MIPFMGQATAQARALSRRTGNTSRGLMRLANGRQAALRRLSTAYFLMTGQHMPPAGSVQPPPADLRRALREQYLWEQHWAQRCLACAGTAKDPQFERLLREQAQSAGQRAGEIRTILEQMAFSS